MEVTSWEAHIEFKSKKSSSQRHDAVVISGSWGQECSGGHVTWMNLRDHGGNYRHCIYLTIYDYTIVLAQHQLVFQEDRSAWPRPQYCQLKEVEHSKRNCEPVSKIQLRLCPFFSQTQLLSLCHLSCHYSFLLQCLFP